MTAAMTLAVVKPGEMTAPAEIDYSVAERVLALGDLAKLTSGERVQYYDALCRSLGLNPLTRPFDYLSLNGKLQLYAKKDCTEQLRRLYRVSLVLQPPQIADGLVIVRANATLPNGRVDEDLGAVPLDANTKGESRANAIMKATTKAKRRTTLSICGLGMLDDSEVDSVSGARRVRIDPHTGEVLGHRPEQPAKDIPPAPDPASEGAIQRFETGIGDAMTLQELQAIGVAVKAMGDRLSTEQRQGLSVVYAARQKVLRDVAKHAAEMRLDIDPDEGP